MALALYRKYRPQTLDDIVGQETTMAILKNAASSGRLGHAYLFYGPRGTGKTTTARLIAKLANCEKRREDDSFRKKGTPCNECGTCQAIEAGSSLDVVEIDAASNRGIDEIRNLKEGIKSAPSTGKTRVYIIDEVHMLTGAAFNAFLKTLEEPPEHAIFVLATTEYEKLPATITSRTQRFLFRKLSKVQIMEKLESIAKKEEVDIEKSALELIAAAAEGSMRDAESMLDQMHSSQNVVSLETVEELLGRVGVKKVEALAKHIVENNLDGALKEVSTIQKEGHSLVQLTKDLTHYLRKVLALYFTPDLEQDFMHELTEDELGTIKKLVEKADADALVRILKALIRSYGEMRYSPFEMIPLEIALEEHLSTNKEK